MQFLYVKLLLMLLREGNSFTLFVSPHLGGVSGPAGGGAGVSQYRTTE